MDRKKVANILDECGTLLELEGEDRFRTGAYHNAARAVENYDGDFDVLLRDKKLGTVKGIGKTMAEKIHEIADTGKLAFHEDLKSRVPPGLVTMTRIGGFGPKRVKQTYDELGITTVDDLRAAALDGRLAKLKGFGPKLATKVLEGISFLEKTGQRVLLPVALQTARELRAFLADHPKAQRLEVCGSVRRGRATCKDIDILVAASDGLPILKAFVEHPRVARVVGQGDTKASVVLDNGMPADLRVVTDEQFPFALHYFTGSKAHNVVMRQRAQQRDLKLNEYGLSGPKRDVKCKEESDIFEALGLEYVVPELREDSGEFAAAEQGSLPTLIERSDLTGCFHNHTDYSDGVATLQQMADAARKAGMRYVGIADHSRTAAYAGGLSVEDVRKQQAEIDRLNEQYDDFRIFKGIESDILKDGSLDYDDELLDSFDYVVASVHAHFELDEAAMTERIIKAIRHPRCTMLGHPTGRLLLKREGYKVDLERVLKEAAKHDVMVEINANPARLDLDWTFCKRAKALGVTLVINPDAHEVHGYDDLEYGVLTARRGWLEAANVFNTRPFDEIVKELDRLRRR